MYFRDILFRYDSGSDVGVLGSGYEFLLSWNLTTKYIIKTHHKVHCRRRIARCFTKYNYYKDIVKNTINDLLAKKELPATAKSLTITTSNTFCIYSLPKIHKPNNPGRPIVSVFSCPTELIFSYLDKIMAPIVKTLKTANTHLKFFANLISLAETNLFSLWISHLLIQSFPMTKVSGPSNIFPINTLLRDL